MNKDIGFFWWKKTGKFIHNFKFQIPYRRCQREFDIERYVVSNSRDSEFSSIRNGVVCLKHKMKLVYYIFNGVEDDTKTIGTKLLDGGKEGILVGDVI